MPDLSVVIANWNTADLVVDCLASLAPADASRQGLSVEVVVVDNASTDDSVARVRAAFPTVGLLPLGENRGYAAANNAGIAASRGRVVTLLNPDTRVPPGALARLVARLDERPDAGAVGPRLLRPDGTAQPFAFGGDPTPAYLARRALLRALGRPAHDWSTDRAQDVDWVSGACLTARREAIDDAGPLDEGYFMYFEDNDWCLRMRRAGWRVVYDPGVEITHIGGQALARNPAARRAYDRSLRRFYAKHYGRSARLALRLLLPIYRWARTAG